LSIVTVIEILIPVNTAAALPIFALKPMSTFTSPQPVAKASAENAFFGFFCNDINQSSHSFTSIERGRAFDDFDPF
jgi:hypothetical protein